MCKKVDGNKEVVISYGCAGMMVVQVYKTIRETRQTG